MKKYFLLPLLFSLVLISCHKDTESLDENNLSENNLEINTQGRTANEILIAEIYKENELWFKVTSDKNYRYDGEQVYSHEALYEMEELWSDDEKTVKFYNPNIAEEFVEFEMIHLSEDEKTATLNLTSGASDEIITFTVENYENEAQGKAIWGVVKEIVEEVIEGFGGNGCAADAIAACGEGNVQSVNYGDTWYGGTYCEFTCC
ncbi:hypothetical protein [uncultured Mesonia sp.]|uniref:hypothetical protein n=1 Tax=uncultured Mesonia sp. TaxID=399731 RepID=UPI00374F96D8